MGFAPLRTFKTLKEATAYKLGLLDGDWNEEQIFIFKEKGEFEVNIG